MRTLPCPCGSGQPSWWEMDARGIALCRVCEKCMKAQLAKYRPEVLSDPSYEADEPIEPESIYIDDPADRSGWNV